MTLHACETIENVDYTLQAPPPRPKNLGEILVDSGKLSADDTGRILDLQRREGRRFGENALQLGLISERDLMLALHRQYDQPPLLSERAPVSEALVTVLQPQHRRSEEFRTLRTQLLTRWLHDGSYHAGSGKVLAVTSPGNREGRSYVAANLAVLFSQVGKRTLLVDADLRNPVQHHTFNIECRYGLATVLAGRTMANAVQPMPGFQNLFLLPAGLPPSNPLELLSRPMLPVLFDEFTQGFDVVLVDTPAALEYADAQAIGYGARHAIVLARKDHTRLADAHQLAGRLQEAGVQVVGSVINNF